ncbi:MAG TPA: hypothetical protein VGD76_09165, partial [Ramlibacter sp.]
MRRSACTPALLALAAGAACAQAPAAPDLAWGVSAGVLNRRLVERTEDGRRLVREAGPMLRAGVDTRLGLRTGGAVQVNAGAAGGVLDYDGQNQVGVPLQTETEHRDLDLALAWRPLPARSWGEAWLVLRALQQRRVIASTPSASGLRETSNLVSVGARWSHAFAAAGWQWQPSLELRTSVRHRLEVDFGGVYDTADIRGARRREAVLAL